MDEETSIEMVRRICDCGKAYWVVEEEDDGKCCDCGNADNPYYYKNILKDQNASVI